MGSLHKILCVGICVVGVANLIHMASIATPRWMEIRDLSEGAQVAGTFGAVTKFSGLFESCTPDQEWEYECDDFTFHHMPMKYQVVQVLAYLAMVCGLMGAGASIVLQLILFITNRPASNVVVICTTAISTTSLIAAAGFDLAVVSIYGDRFVKKDANLAYSFYLCLLAISLYASGAILVTHASRTINAGFSPEGAGSQEETVQFSPKAETVQVMTSSIEVKDETNGELNA